MTMQNLLTILLSCYSIDSSIKSPNFSRKQEKNAKVTFSYITQENIKSIYIAKCMQGQEFKFKSLFPQLSK